MVKATCVCPRSKDQADLAERCGAEAAGEPCPMRGPSRRLTGDTGSIAETTEEHVNPATVSSRELREKFAKEQTKRLHKNRSPWKPDRDEAKAWTEGRLSREMTSLPLRYPTSAYPMDTQQENTESAPMKLKVLGTMGVPYKRFEALPVIDSQFQARRSP